MNQEVVSTVNLEDFAAVIEIGPTIVEDDEKDPEGRNSRESDSASSGAWQWKLRWTMATWFSDLLPLGLHALGS